MKETKTEDVKTWILPVMDFVPQNFLHLKRGSQEDKCPSNSD